MRFLDFYFRLKLIIVCSMCMAFYMKGILRGPETEQWVCYFNIVWQFIDDYPTDSREGLKKTLHGLHPKQITL